jgi:guanylate kinase
MQGRLLSKQEAAEFGELLKGYRPNPVVEQDFLHSSFGVIAGPSGAGKDTLRNALISEYPEDFVNILSTTTRPMRVGEQDGIDYHFRSVESVQDSLNKQEFLQVALVHNQQISALHIDEIRKLRQNQIGLSILIVQTEAELRQPKPDIKTIFIVPPSVEEWKNRLHTGGGITNEEIERRLSAAKKELMLAQDNQDYYCLVSENLDDLSRAAYEFFVHGKKLPELDENARYVVKALARALD